MAKASQLQKTDKIIKKHKSTMSGLIGMLQDVQNEYSYLPKEVLIDIAEKLKAPLSQVYSLATFYKAFSLKKRGKHLVALCMGTACHVRRADGILDELEKKLGIKAGETTKDSRFSLETVNCLGCCAIGPVMMIGDKYYGELTAKKVAVILEKYKKL